MYSLLFLPFCGFILLSIFGKRSNAWAGAMAVVVTSLGLAASAMLVQEVRHEPITAAISWLQLQDTTFYFSFRCDRLALLMLFIVHLIGLLVQLFSVAYMANDPARWRYFAFLQLFLFAMIGIVLAGNLLLMYIFWELVGFCSYLLIGFWYIKPRAAWASQKAFLLNRIGDAGFLAGILLLIANGQSLEFEPMLTPASTTVGLLLFCGTVAKSAQWPLSTWLPDAMEGPTPVSALIHAATMVAAGIFLLARIHPILTPDALLAIALVGIITTILGTYKAVFQDDIKKLLAYSTVSQLGLMVLAMGIDAPEAAIFHLLTHAFFKAGLFLSAGAIIHYLHIQSMKDMGGLRHKLPVVFVTYTICAAALAGIPFFSGFLSKDSILVATTAWATERGGLAYTLPILAFGSVGLTAFYVARQWRLVFLDTPRSTVSGTAHLNWLIYLPLITLATLSLFCWFSFNPFNAQNGWFFQFFKAPMYQDLHTLVAVLSVVVTSAGLFWGYKTAHQTFVALRFRLALVNDFSDKQPAPFLIPLFQKVAQLLAYFDRWVLDVTVNGFAYLSVIGAHVVARVEHLLIDGSVNALAWLVQLFGKQARNLQNGKVQSYFVVMLVGVILMIFWFLA
jgi:NADH-quinone oxidoreductase subunit L